MRPHLLTVASTSICRSSFEEMLAWTAIARSSPNVLLIAAATFSQAVAFRDEITTFAPCSASLKAIALPIPREEPVTIATFPARSNNVTAFLQTFQGAAEPDQCKTDPFARTHQRLRPLHHY